MIDKHEIARFVIDTSLVQDMTVREIERIDYRVLKGGGSQKAGIDQRVAIAAMYVWKKIKGFRYTEAGTQLTFRKLNEVSQDTRLRFTQQHIINYLAYQRLEDLYDYLCDKKYINKAAEGCWRKVERCFRDYQKEHRTIMDNATWGFFLDHMRLSSDSLMPAVDSLEIAVRDYLIQHRKELQDAKQKDDIALLQKVAVCFILLTSMQHSFRDYFIDIVKAHGVDFSNEFRYANLDKMIRNTMWMCEKLGIRFGTDEDGDTVLLGVGVGNSIRVDNAWKAVLALIKDEELSNENVKQALKLNPVKDAEYKVVYDEEKRKFEEKQRHLEEKKMEKSLHRLEQAYKVIHTS